MSASDRGEHLVPSTSALYGSDFQIEYHDALRATFGFDRTSLCHIYARVVVTPSFEREFMVDVAAPEGETAVVRCAKARTVVWRGDQTPKRADIDDKAVSIPRNVAEAVHSAWIAMLETTRPSTKNTEIGCDGTFYDFAGYKDGTGMVSGRTWSPPANSSAGRLVDLVLGIQALCGMSDPDRAQRADELRKRALDLAADIRGRQQR